MKLDPRKGRPAASNISRAARRSGLVIPKRLTGRELSGWLVRRVSTPARIPGHIEGSVCFAIHSRGRLPRIVPFYLGSRLTERPSAPRARGSRSTFERCSSDL